MKRFCLSLACLAIAVVMAAGCGRRGDTVAADEWRTVVTLNSDDPFWGGTDNILMSAPFTASGEVRLVLDMPDAGRLDGVVGMLVPVESATDLRTLHRAAREGDAVLLSALSPSVVVPDVEGDRVFVNTVPAARPWTLEIQIRP